MHDTPADTGRPVPPPVLTRTVPEARPVSTPLMPPFVPRRATASQPIANQADGEEPRTAAEPDAWPMAQEEGSAEPAWDNGEEIAGGPADFPLDAFIIPEDTQRLPTGYDEEHHAIAERVALRLDEIARRVRTGGLAELGAAPASDELTRLIATVVAGHLGRGGAV